MIEIYQKNKLFAFSLLSLSVFFLSSCQTTKNVPYFKDVSLAEQSTLSNTAAFKEPTIQPDDILSISIFTIDPATSMVVNQLGTQAISASTAAIAGGVAATAPTSGFLVNKQGEIDLSIVGKLKLSGLTTVQAQDLIKEKAALMYTNPNVQVRYANFKVTVLGEVARPAAYTLPNEKVSVLDALGLAGDLTIYGKRENILVVRDNNGQKEFARLNLNSKELFNSPYYYLKQNDVLYVEPSKARAAANNADRIQIITVVVSILTVLSLLITRL